MLNKEKYMNELMKYACRKPMESGFAVLKTGVLADCTETACGECKFCNHAEDCKKARMEWLEQEYEPSVDWTKVPVDTPILVKSKEDDDWTNRYFAEYKNETVFAWYEGATSWSANHENVISWKYAKLAEREE